MTSPGQALQAAVDAALAEYEPGEPEDFEGRVVAVLCEDEEEARETVEAMEGAALSAATLEHEGTWYAYVTDLHGSDPADVWFELGWHNFEVGTIPDPGSLSSEASTGGK